MRKIYKPNVALTITWGMVFGVLTILLLLSTGSPPAQATTDKEVIIEGNNAFALEMYGQSKSAEKGKNYFFSPASISTALAMTYAGARGETASQMARTLHFRIDQARLHPAFSRLLSGLKGDDKVELAIANALWAQRGLVFQTEFLDITERYYGGAFRQMDFVGQPEESRLSINSWVEDQTRGRIKDLLGKDDVTRETKLVLTNAIYFKGSWASRFDSKRTRMEPFHLKGGKTIQALMMRQNGVFGLFMDEKLAIFRMPYADGKLSMVIIMPRKDELDETEKLFIAGNLRVQLSSLSQQNVDVQIPKFMMKSSFCLNSALISLGMIDAFSEKANFNGISAHEALFISKVLHKAFVDVGEEGTEAAAATAVRMGRSSMSEAQLIFNRPFIFMVRDEQSGTIIFLGRLMNPAE